MIKVIFKDLEKSELAKSVAEESMNDLVDKFPDLKNSHISLTLSMQNSPTQAGPDLFTVKFYCKTGRYRGVIMQRSAPNLYKALSELSNSLLERLNRFGDKKRVKKIKRARLDRLKSRTVDGWDSEKMAI
ncbi:MAG: hypothetical protein KDD40_02395 [Bdellovibrionales bacterium]|nr:hypothetical protein [Bdellovibrionales bacterium]